ncbi:hypothetical protein L6278_00670 [Candidatus Parcubacteria bacterium]|nr:hypothetical protein [Patescibacteria group bacterium]MCG2686632.1 hypothetical protein [Candidatus Parcubacteria bacterium]
MLNKETHQLIWDIDEKVLKFWTNNNIKEQLKKCIKIIEKINQQNILQGLGEVLSDKDKEWAKKNLKQETLFLLKSYLSVS